MSLPHFMREVLLMRLLMAMLSSCSSSDGSDSSAAVLFGPEVEHLRVKVDCQPGAEPYTFSSTLDGNPGTCLPPMSSRFLSVVLLNLCFSVASVICKS